MKFTANNVVVVINVGNEICSYLIKKKNVYYKSCSSLAKIVHKYLQPIYPIYSLFGELFPFKLGFWGLEYSWEKNLLYSLLCVTDQTA